MRYEALFSAAFVAGLIGAMSQQNVASPTRVVHNALAADSAASSQVIIPLAAAPIAAAALAPEPPAPADVAPTTAKDVAAEAKPAAPVKKVKLAKKQKPKPQIAAAPPPEPVRHSFWYRLFHKTPDKETVAAAESK